MSVDPEDPEITVHLHVFDLDAPPLPVARLAALLDEGERDRAARFHFATDRRRYTTGRGLLRILLGRATGRAPGALRLVAGPHGKPRLDGASRGVPAFNLSHSERLCVIALGGPGVSEVGVDVEVVRPVAEVEGVARQVFDGDERAWLLPLRGGADWIRFHRLWTAKEAVLKLLGTGFSLDPLAFRVDLAEGGAFSVHPRGADAGALPVAGVSLDPLPLPGGGTAAAAVVSSPPCTSVAVLDPGLPAGVA